MITAELLGVEEDSRKNIIIWINFKKDSVDIPFPQTFNNRPAWRLYSSYANFLSKTPAQRLQWIRANVESQIGNIIREIVAKQKLVDEVKTQLTPLIGQTIQKDSVTIPVDLNNDGVDDATVTLKDDGTYTVA